MAILILAGEMSGDRYGAELAKSIKESAPNHQIISAGGESLEKVSDQFISNITTHSAIGLQSKIQGYFAYKSFYKTLNKTLQSQPIEAAIIIDFQHHNFKIASLLQKSNIPILTFITPNFWLYQDLKRMKKLAQYSKEIVCIFKREEALYKKIHKNVHYFGHPLVSISGIKQKKPSKKIQTIGLMPGSRKQEMTLYLNAMLETVKTYHQQNSEARFILLPSSNYFLTHIQSKLDAELLSLIHIWDGDNDSFFNEIDCLLVASGSSTLDAILHSVPMVVLCALTPLTFFAAKYILRLKIPYISLPNIIAQKHIVPELVQSEITPDKIIDAINSYNEQSVQESRLKNYKDIQNSMDTGANVFKRTVDLLMKNFIS
jgi:lipid-A-disaccharide synthase